MFTNWFNPTDENKVGFEDVLYTIQNPGSCLLINVLPSNEQSCLIIGTIPMENEEQEINQCLQNNDHSKIIIIYGKHSCDTKVEEKYKQLKGLGFSRIFMFQGGLFEWLLLQDIYSNEFPSTSKPNDLLLYRPKPVLNK